ncbi:MAG: MFS transporter [Clostridia bacterium]|nr:MFS transporter [Clostridia bacterium]
MERKYMEHAAPAVFIALVGMVSLFSVATGVMLTSIEMDYGVTTSAVGLIPALSSGGESLAYVLAGFWRKRRLGIRELAAYFICLFLVTLAIGLRPPFFALCMLYGLLGLLVGFLNFAGNTVVASSYTQDRSKYIAILYVSMGMGCALASLYPTSALDRGVYWGRLYRQYALYVALLAVAAITALLPRLHRFGDISCGSRVEGGGESALSFLVKKGRAKLAALCLVALMYQGHQIVLVSWIASYMTQWLHVDAVSAGVTISLFSMGLLISRLLSALLSKRFTTRQMVVAGCLLGGGLLASGLFAGRAAAMMVTFPLAGMVTGWILPMVISCGYNLFPENPVAVASTINTASALGGMSFSWLAGIIAHSVSFPAAISLTVLNLLAAALLMLLIPSGRTAEKQ